MLRLMLLRHAKTEEAEPGRRDRDRKLVRRGRDDASTIGTYMARQRLLPDLVMVSPAARTQETCSLVAAGLAELTAVANAAQGLLPVLTDERIYNATCDKLVGAITMAPPAKTLLVVGHNPSLHELAVRLIVSGDTKGRERINEKLPTSGLVVIDLPIEDWSLLQARTGLLERFVTPRSVDATG